MPNKLYNKLEAAAKDVTCLDWRFGQVLSPQNLLERFEADYQRQPGPITEARIEQVAGKWAVIFVHPPMPNSRTLQPGTMPIEAIIDFTPAQIEEMTEFELRRSFVSIILMMQAHEMLEWAQLTTVPGEPIINPHRMSDDLIFIADKVRDAILRDAV